MVKKLKGLTLASSIALLAFLVAPYALIGSVTVAIILGIILGNSITVPTSYQSGLSYAEKTLLAYAIALMGVQLDFQILSSFGLKTIVIIVLGMVITIYSGLALAKLYKADTKLGLLLGIGNGVCGSSAISATAPIIKVDQKTIGISVAIVNLLGTFGIFLLPLVAFSLGFDEIESGILIGNTLQAVGQVAAAGFSISDTAGISATTVKMGRVLLLTPLVLILLYIFHTQNDTVPTKQTKIPGFIVIFIFLSILNSFGLIQVDIKHLLTFFSELFLLVAMAAIGVSISIKSLRFEGKVFLKIASYVFLIQIIFTAGLLLLL